MEKGEWMKIITIAYYTFLRHIRDVKAIAAFILLPLVMMLILGNALNNEFTPKKIEASKVGFLSHDRGVLNDNMRKFLNSEKMKTLLHVKQVNSIESAEKMVKSGELKGFIYLPTNLSKRVQKGESVVIEFYSKEKNSYIKPLLESFIREVNVGNTLLKLNGNIFEDSPQSKNINEVKIVTEGKIPRGIDYYTITTLFQSLLFGAVFGVFSITKDLGNHTYLRQFTSPIRGRQVTLGKFIGSTLTLYGISILIFLVTKFLFNANWGGSLWIILLVLFLFTAISTGFGMIFAYVTKSTMISSLSLFIVSTVLTLVSGGFAKLDGKVFTFLSYFSPNTYGQDVLFTDIYEGTIASDSLMKLSLYLVLILLLTFMFGRRKVV